MTRGYWSVVHMNRMCHVSLVSLTCISGTDFHKPRFSCNIFCLRRLLSYFFPYLHLFMEWGSSELAF